MDWALVNKVFWMAFEQITLVHAAGMFWLLLLAIYHDYQKCHILLSKGVSVEGIIVNKTVGDQISVTINNYIIEYVFNCNPKLCCHLLNGYIMRYSQVNIPTDIIDIISSFYGKEVIESYNKTLGSQEWIAFNTWNQMKVGDKIDLIVDADGAEIYHCPKMHLRSFNYGHWIGLSFWPAVIGIKVFYDAIYNKRFLAFIERFAFYSILAWIAFEWGFFHFVFRFKQDDTENKHNLIHEQKYEVSCKALLANK